MRLMTFKSTKNPNGSAIVQLHRERAEILDRTWNFIEAGGVN
jgi:hypothetical protein